MSALPPGLERNRRAARFRQLHEGAGILILGKAWSIGSARRLEGMGYAALGTSSAALAAGLGLEDNGVGRDRVLAHARTLAAATELPVSADLEDGFGPRPEDCAETIRLAIEAAAADVLFAPNLPDLQAVQPICAAVTRPVNILMGPASPDWSLAELQAAGVRRVSLGHALARTAEDAWTAAARAVLGTGRFAYRRAVVERFAG